MCPEKELLSVYLDGELPSPWKERMEAHVASCSSCASLLKKFALYSDLLQQQQPEIDVYQEKVWRNISARWNMVKRRRSVWNRTISLPVPTAAAAAVVFIAVFVFAVARPFPRGVSLQDTATAAFNPLDIDVKNMAPDSDMMGAVLRYLEEEGGSDYMLIKLPESKEFSASGGPAILKAVDYSKKTGTR